MAMPWYGARIIVENIICRLEGQTELRYVKANKLKPQPGDLIEFHRGRYKHWALYVGDGFVVHVRGDAEQQIYDTIKSGTAKVHLNKLADVAENWKVRINNQEEQARKHGVSPLPLDAIVEGAKKMVDRTVRYNLADQNCEHYVTQWRYGRSWSWQVMEAAAVAGVGAYLMAKLAPGLLETARHLPIVQEIFDKCHAVCKESPHTLLRQCASKISAVGSDNSDAETSASESANDSVSENTSESETSSESDEVSDSASEYESDDEWETASESESVSEVETERQLAMKF